jgi:hypothetical protein
MTEPPGLSPLVFITFKEQILKQCHRRTGKIRTGYWNMRPVFIQALVCFDDVIGTTNEAEIQLAVIEWASACR